MLGLVLTAGEMGLPRRLYTTGHWAQPVFSSLVIVLRNLMLATHLQLRHESGAFRKSFVR